MEAEIRKVKRNRIRSGKAYSIFQEVKKSQFCPNFFNAPILSHSNAFTKWDITNNDMMLWGIIANVFAVLEHINYFHIQLMVDNKYDYEYIVRNKRFKKASLAKDLGENEI